MKVQVKSMKESARLVKESILLDADIPANDTLLYSLGEFARHCAGNVSAYKDADNGPNEFTVEVDSVEDKQLLCDKLALLQSEKVIAGFYQNVDNSVVIINQDVVVESKEAKKESSDDYKQGYEDGKDAWESGHPDDPDDMTDVSEDYYKGYWDGFYAAQEEANEEFDESKKSKKESSKPSSKPSFKKAQELLKQFVGLGIERGPENKPEVEEFFIEVEDNFVEGKQLESMLQQVESEYPNEFEYEGVDWDNKYWFNVKK